MPMGFPAAGFASGQRYVPEPGDTFVCTYPKCGTTWTQYILYLLQYDAEPLRADQRLDSVSPHLEEVGAEAVAALAPPRVVKTHLERARTPWSVDANYVVVLRNPFDCAVSFYHHTRGFVRHYDFADGTFDEFFECFIAGEVDFGDYFDHLRSWVACADEPNVLVLTYEDMLADARAALRRLGDFVGGAAQAAAHDEGVAERVLRASSFASMSRDQARWSSARPAGMPAFVRKGAAAAWEECMTRAQARRLAERFDERTAGTAAARLWPELLARARG
jgi:hypothetical protein